MKVLLVGAYERDNVGDLLYLTVTERHLRGVEITAAAPFDADMTPLLGRHVPAYGPLLDRERFDAIWTVGGQVGSIDAGRAFRMSASPDQLNRFLRSTRWKRRATLEALGLGVAPYIPDAHHPGLRIVNSAGVYGIRHVPAERRDALLALLRAQDVVSVRDRASSELLAEHRIAHELVPDAVHALGVQEPFERVGDDGTAIVQISRAILNELGPEWVAAQLAHSRELRGARIRFLLAGAAPGHDSAIRYGDLVRRIARLRPDADVGILRERDPLTIVDQTRRARVVIGTSLHVRVIAAAYGVPRVSLARPKVTRYAQTWDAAMPYAVTLDRIDDAVESALALGRRAESAAHAASLAETADAHLARLAERVCAPALVPA